MIEDQSSAAGSVRQRPESTIDTSGQRRQRIGLRSVVATYLLMYPTILAAGFFLPFDKPRDVIFIALSYFTDSVKCLFGIWLVCGGGGFLRRAAYTLVGASYCQVMMMLEGVHLSLPSSVFVWYYASPVVEVAAAFLVLHRLGTRLVFIDRPSPEECNRRLQFSLRSLIGVSACVTILLAIARSGLQYDTREQPFIGLLGSVVCTILIALAAAWAALGLGRPLPRVLVVTFVYIVVDLACRAIFAERIQDVSMTLYVLFFILSVISFFVVIIPLLVVRSYGYRFVRLPKSESATVPTP